LYYEMVGQISNGCSMTKIRSFLICSFLGMSLITACGSRPPRDSHMEVSGIYPHLAVFNSQNECGIGAVVPWADRLWAVTYSPHRPLGSDDKLYSINRRLNLTIHPESIGGTPANRMIHRESQQLIIGPYFIDRRGRVRTVPYESMPGRHTATARHLTDPENRVYVLTMEEGLYEVDVETLDVKEVYPDGYRQHAAQGSGDMPILPGYHGKGGYTGQGRVVYSNNGEWDSRGTGYQEIPSGCLAEWDGRDWAVIERRQFTEVTGPGGIYGNIEPEDPIWASGWDQRSVILMLREGGGWSRFRLPKASFTYDGAHGWHTEWPRIRSIEEDRALMTMHGMFWDFPLTFQRADTSGIRPLSSYLKIVVDFCAWGDRLVFACDDASKFDNRLVGQSQSNFWFLDPSELPNLGPASGFGGVWVNDDAGAGSRSDPFLLAGFISRVLHLHHRTPQPVLFTLEVDRLGLDEWEDYARISLPPGGYAYHIVPQGLQAEWIRLSPDRDCLGATAYFYSRNGRSDAGEGDDAKLFQGLARIGEGVPLTYGLVRIPDRPQGYLEFAAYSRENEGESAALGCYALSPDLRLEKVENPQTCAEFIREAGIPEPEYRVDDASVILTDSRGRHFRLPKGDPAFETKSPGKRMRGIREVVTERSLLNCNGTFYELPRDISGGVKGIKPVCTHNRFIHDFCSWRGLLVLSGLRQDAPPGEHIVRSLDGAAGLWLGTIDDLWRLGKPRGRGGPWNNTPVTPGRPSDPYLMTGYDRKRVEVWHDSPDPVTFALEVDITGHGLWVDYTEITVEPNELEEFRFPAGYSAHWVRVRCDTACTAGCTFIYE
jgi:hypothetical protein